MREIRNTNAAIALAFGVCNSLLSLKKQHVKGLKDNYDSQKTAFIEFHEKRNSGAIPKDLPFEFETDFRTLQSQVLPMDTLRAVVFERLSIVGRPLNLFVTLNETVECLAESLAKRNSLIIDYKVKFAEEPQHLVPLYFGFPVREGHLNLEYPDTVDAIYNQTDSGIFFSYLLCKDLYEHGKQLSDDFKKKFKDAPPRVSEVDFGPAKIAGLMPDEENYVDWIKGFVKKAP